MKRRILVLLLALLLLLLCSCGHKHSHADSYSSDENYHWNECSCGDKKDMEQHSWNAGSVTLKPTATSEGERTYTCTVCRAQKTEKIDKLEEDHAHSYDNLVFDENSHWYECVCGEKSGVSAHAWDDGVITKEPTDTAYGEKTFTCTLCGCESKRALASTSDDGLSFTKSTYFKLDDKLSKNPLTIEADICVNPSVTERSGAIFGNYLGLEKDEFLFEIYENGVPRFWYVDAGGNAKDIRFTQVDVRTGEWIHIAVSFDIENAVVSLYLDGQLAQSVAVTTDMSSNIPAYGFVVGGDGRSGNGNYFKGKIKSLAVYSDVRTAAELADSAKNGVDSDAEDILLHYVLNPKSGEADIKDLSPNGFDIAKEWLDSYESDFDYAYSFAVVGDTQWLSKYAPAKLEGIYDWILENQESKKIAHIFGLGDITEDWNTAGKEQEWIRAYRYISKLDGKISYSLVRGNHDESKYFLKYFANETYMSQFDGFIAEGDIRNSYMLFTIGETDYLFLTLDFGAGDEMLAWANEVVLSYPNHRVIVTTHGYQGFDGNRIAPENSNKWSGTAAANDVDSSVGNNARGYNDGQQIWDKFISKHPNIFLVMCGHTPFEDVINLQTKGDHGNIVNQMVIDPQWMDPQKGGVGMVAMLYFSEDGTQMAVEWISTDTGKYYQEQNQFVLDLTNSLNAPAHDFKNAYDEKTHHMACDCGYVHSAEPHVFDGGVLNADGFMVYSCACGYKRVASATNDPVALELQALLETYYNGGVYYKHTNSSSAVFYNGDKYVIEGTSYDIGNALSLKDIILGKHGDLKLDLGWNLYEGVYSSSNASTVSGFKTFAGVDAAADKVTVETYGSTLIITLWSGSTKVSETNVGYYAVITLERLGGTVIDVTYVKANDNYMCEFTAPAVDGYVAEYDKLYLDVRHSELNKTVYYSTITKWDGKTVSTSLKGSGTLDDPFLIESGADLAYIAGVVNAAPEKTANFLGKYFKMTQSIDLDGRDLYIGSYTGWGTRTGFSGFFDGNHCTVRGLDQSRSLFGTIEYGYLKNLSVYGKISNSTDEATGGISGYAANGGVLENLTSYVTINCKNTLGGIVGNAEGGASTVIGCVNYGDVTGSSWIIGGVAGSGGHEIINCVNYGNVTSVGNDVVGGIAGSTKNTGKIENCYNYGTISARGKAAGIVGQANKPVSGCVNYGDVNGVWALAGIVGYTKNTDSVVITDCVNFGNITATSTGIGGIFGIIEGGASATGAAAITNCTNNGNVKGTWGVGGIAGDTPGVITACINNGMVSASGDLGGIIGKAYGKITECINNGEVVGTQVNIGGIVGRLHVSTYSDVINTTNYQNGTITGSGAGDIIGKIES